MTGKLKYITGETVLWFVYLAALGTTCAALHFDWRETATVTGFTAFALFVRAFIKACAGTLTR